MQSRISEGKWSFLHVFPLPVFARQTMAEEWNFALIFRENIKIEEPCAKYSKVFDEDLLKYSEKYL